MPSPETRRSAIRWSTVRRLKPVHVVAGIVAVAALLTQGCQELPSLANRPASSALQDTADTRLGRAVTKLTDEHPNNSGVITVSNGLDAFAVRAVLAEAADKSLDVQYYIWKEDLSGLLLIRTLAKAADRGVRVRLLLDDNTSTTDRDKLLAALDAHSNIEVRFFNPFLTRDWHWLGYLTDFSRLNRRMHNKSFTADNQVSVVGGRNVGDEYFGATDEVAFLDLDAIAVGPVVREVSQDFDAYWACGSSYPTDGLLPHMTAEEGAAFVAQRCDVEGKPEAAAYVQALARQPFVRDLLARRVQFEWTKVQVVTDNPAKGLGQAQQSDELLPQLARIVGRPTSTLEIVSPYFVPTKAGTDAFTSMVHEGVNVSILTNSMAATDVAPVHAGYVKWRKELLRGGVALYELKPLAKPSRLKDTGFTGSSGSSLHAKTMAIDKSRVFIGSFNFDPRSAVHNTEIGFIIESPTLAQKIDDMFTTKLPDYAYVVRLNEKGDVIWIEKTGTESVTYDDEPGIGWFRRMTVIFLSWLPIEGML